MMAHSQLLSALLIGVVASTVTLESAQTGVREIQQLAGCFEVSYRFAEDGTRDIFSERYGLANPAKEWVSLTRTDDNTVVLQHILFAGASSFPHWHELWTWHSGTRAWTQEVRGGAPSSASQLRYRCTAPWTGNRWECHAGKAEKPVRDAKRGDYDWLDRTNVLLVTPNGWVHNEHNRKMRSPDELVSHELGWITYRRLSEAQCQANR